MHVWRYFSRFEGPVTAKITMSDGIFYLHESVRFVLIVCVITRPTVLEKRRNAVFFECTIYQSGGKVFMLLAKKIKYYKGRGLMMSHRKAQWLFQIL